MDTPDYHIENAAWVGNKLTFARFDNLEDDVVEKKLRRPLLSPSVADAYNGCPASAAGSRLMPRVDDPFAANEMGTAGHEVLEELFKLPSEERARDAARDLLEKIADRTWASEKLVRAGKKELAANQQNRSEWTATINRWIDGYFQIEDPRTINVHSVEYKLDSVSIGAGVGGDEGIPLKGFVDRTDIVERDGESALEVVDYKFGKPKLKPDPRYGDSYGDQQRIYLEGYAEKLGVRPIGAKLLFPRGPGVRQIDASPDEIRKTLLGFRAGWNTMNHAADTRQYEAQPSALCSWCPLVNSCPVAKLSNKANAVEQRKKAPSELQLGIPKLRDGATLDDVRDAGGVTVPSRATPVSIPELPVIKPVGGDPFPVTMPGGTPPADIKVAAGADSTPKAADGFAELAKALFGTPVDDTQTSAGGTSAPWDGWTDADAATPAQMPERNGLGAVHVEGDSNIPESKEHLMTQELSPQVRAEAVPYQETAGEDLNLNSYAAGAVSGLISLSFDHLNKANVAPTPVAISHLANVFTGIVLRAQHATTGTLSFQQGAQTRLRGFLHTFLEHRPAPFGGPSAEWEAWIARAERFLITALSEAIALWGRRPVANDSHLYFATDVATSTP